MDTIQLQKRIEALEKWKAERTSQQIMFPLDYQSQVILSNYFMTLTDTVEITAGAGGNVFTYYVGNQGSRIFQVQQNTFIPYTVNTGADTVTVAGGLYFEDDTNVYVATSDTPPNPLSITGDYWIINSTGQTFQLALTQGGAAINITNTGVGKQYIYFF